MITHFVSMKLVCEGVKRVIWAVITPDLHASKSRNVLIFGLPWLFVVGANAIINIKKSELTLGIDGDPRVRNCWVRCSIDSSSSSVPDRLSQIYSFKPTWVTISGTFIVLIAYWVGKAWAALLPRGDLQEKQWTEKGGQGSLPLRIRLARFINPGPWNLKEHTVCAITATSASNAAASITVFTAQDLFYDLPPNATTIILSVTSIGLFGYGLCGVLRPICV
ncbi:hypothetical protein E4U22_004758 [Claviceps purpurea]|nr:hypothetical protein E4U22_004758 [Claviceps purpurea]